jgi:hypothetical protein
MRVPDQLTFLVPNIFKFYFRWFMLLKFELILDLNISDIFIFIFNKKIICYVYFFLVISQEW